MKKLQLLLSLLVILVMVLSSCTQATTEAPAPAEEEKPTATVVEEPTATSIAIEVKEETPTAVPVVEEAQYKQAPILDGMDLPPVEERLPESPVVTTPLESIGKYGGSLSTMSWWPGVGNVLLYISEPPIKWKADLTGYEPGLAENYEWSDDGTTFTLYLRKGLKWSDGEPYTSEDWRFWWEDLAVNEDVRSVSVPGYLRNTDGSPITMEFPDEYTVVWKSDKPLWIAPYYMAQGFWEFANPMMKPAHWLKAYHPLYESTKTYDDLQAIDMWWQTPGYPCLFAWCLADLSSDGLIYTFKRNPYYWRVDTEGNQLPYIDEIMVTIIADEQARILACSEGKFDTAFRTCGGPNEIPLLDAQGVEKGFHRLLGWMNGAGAWPGYMVNQYYVEGGKNYEDDTPEHAAEIRTLLRDKNFRQALSTCFDRQRIIDVAWAGIGEVKNYTLSPQSWHFVGEEGQAVYQEWASAYVTEDVEGANAMLDSIGFVDANGDGFRDLPSGKDFTLVMDITDWGGSLKVQTDAAAEMEVEWETKCGIAVEVKNLQGQPEENIRVIEGQYMLKGAHISEIDIWTYPDWIFPIVNRYMFPLEGRWWADGKDTCVPVEGVAYDCGVKPEPGSPAEKLQALYEEGQQTKTVEERHAIVWAAIRDVLIEEGPFVIGVAGDQPMPIYVKDFMRNILDFGVVGPWAPATPGNQVAAQWWMDQ